MAKERYLSDIINFLTSYDKKKTNIFYKVLRYFDYKKLRSNYTFKDIASRPTYDLLREFIYSYQIVDRLFRLSENSKYDFISIQTKIQHHKSENIIMDSKYEITILKVNLPDENYTISWDSVLKEIDMTVNSNRHYTITGEYNDYAAYILDIARYVFDIILDDFWCTHIRDLNKSYINITKLKLSSLKVNIEYTNERQYFSIDNNSVGKVQIDDRRYAMIFLIRGCVCLYDDTYYSYECNLVVEYIEYAKEYIDVARLHIFEQLEIRKSEIKEYLEFAVSSFSYWDHILGTI